MASGRRKGFEAKNDPDGERRSERRISAHVPQFEHGQLKTPSVVFEAVTIQEEAPKQIAPIVADNVDVVPLNPTIKSEYGSSIVQLNVSPIQVRKSPESTASVSPTNRPPSPVKQVETARPTEEINTKTQSITVEAGRSESELNKTKTEEAPKSSRRAVPSKPRSGTYIIETESRQKTDSIVNAVSPRDDSKRSRHDDAKKERQDNKTIRRND